ncbi:hypothetical protein AB0M43_36665 [Longispora sp. NPDC051575]|uniref:hypothetical protein n=1 Tax=Longispora sp. NPDC051575 TaxID=3154943 RepID=UPI0034244E23
MSNVDESVGGNDRADSVARVLVKVRAVLGDPAGWVSPGGYPGSLALCAIDAIQSLGVRYTSVERVVARYRNFRREQGHDPNADGVTELLHTFSTVGGARPWAETIGTLHRTSTHAGAPLKAEAIEQAARALAARRILTCRDLASAEADHPGQAKAAWLLVRGQRSGTSWRYLLMLSGTPGVKPDRMIIRFVATALDRPESTVSTQEAVRLITSVARELGVSATLLDHAVWRWQSGRRVNSSDR